MNADTRGLLALLWIASPALPVGAFSYSEGLEAGVDDRQVHDEASAGDWLIDQLHLCLARSDLPVAARSRRAALAEDADRLRSLDQWVRCNRESAELRLQSEQMGHALWAWLCGLALAPRAVWTATDPPTLPVAQGLALAALAQDDITDGDALTALAFAWAENAVQAAIKAVPLGQAAGQRVLRRLVAEIPTAVRTALQRANDSGPCSLQSYTPGLALLSSRHETQYSRLFRS